MKQFKDNEARAWSVELTIATVKRVRDLLDVDLLRFAETDLLDKLANDPVLLCDVLYCICKPEADERGISDEQFGRAMAGDAIDEATDAFQQALVDFFPSRRREVLAKAVAKLDDVRARALEMAADQLDSVELERRIDAALAQAFGQQSTKPPES